MKKNDMMSLERQAMRALNKSITKNKSLKKWKRKLKRLFRAMTGLFLIGCLAVTASAAKGPNVHTEQTVYSWYCRHMRSHTPPQLDGALRFTQNHQCCFRNVNATDDAPVIYLTFDLGYENGNTEKILDVLDTHGAKAAFFVLKHVVESNTDLVRRIAESGHLVCNHTASHKDMSQIGDEKAFLAELEELNAAYRDTLGFEMARFYRPPEGKFTEQNLTWAENAGYTTVFWSFAYADWDNKNQPNTEQAYRKIIDNTHNGEIILLHPTSATNAAVMDRLLSEWERMGYRFGSLTDFTVSGGDTNEASPS